MSRARNKQELLNFGRVEFDRLISLVGQLSPEQRDQEHIFDNRTSKDLVAHVYAWQLLELTWYEEDMAGKNPVIPAPGYTFKDAPALNEKLYQDYKNISWGELKNNFLIVMINCLRLSKIIQTKTSQARKNILGQAQPIWLVTLPQPYQVTMYGRSI